MRISLFEICKIFHYLLRRIADENWQTYPLVTVDTGHMLIKGTNMNLTLKSFCLSFFTSLLFVYLFIYLLIYFLQWVLYLQDELFCSA